MYNKDELYLKASDEELIKLLREGNSEACDILIRKYMPLVKKSPRFYYLEGGDREDLIQEGMLGLFKAVREYDFKRDSSFYTFAKHCINNQIFSAIEAAGRKKHKALNESVSFEALPDRDIENLVSSNPEAMLVEEESAKELLEYIYGLLSPMEKRVLELYIEGMDYHAIAAKIGKSEKSVDNALQRIKTKVKKTKK